MDALTDVVFDQYDVLCNTALEHGYSAERTARALVALGITAERMGREAGILEEDDDSFKNACIERIFLNVKLYFQVEPTFEMFYE